MDLPPYLSPLDDERCLLVLRVLPGARRDALDGEREGALRVRITARAVEGAANKAVVTFLARKILRLPRSAVRIVRGERARHKQVQIDAPAAAVAAALRSA